jgi:Na+/phosphate symporter
MKFLECVSPLDLTVISILIGLLFVVSLDNDELDVLGNVLIGIGGIMVIASTQGDYLESIAEMEKQKTELEKQLKSLNKKGVKYR